MTSKVSIIVPVYNVEQYIERCLNSIVSQTYANLEIILVDDGSTDSSGNICKKYSEKDKRIKYIYQENKGLSGARNAGIDNSTGDYLCFIDSDDWVERDYLMSAMKIFDNDKVDIAIFGYFISSENDDKISTKGWLNKEFKIVDKNTALKLLVEDININSHAWDKIFKKELFKTVRFPVGKNFEDIFIMHEIFNSCEKIAISKQPKYHYFERENSIARNYNTKNVLNYFEAEWCRYEYLINNNFELQKLQIMKMMELVLSYYPKRKFNKNMPKHIVKKYNDELKNYYKKINDLYKKCDVGFDNKKYYYMYKIYKKCRLLYKIVYAPLVKIIYHAKNSKYKEQLKTFLYKNKDFELKIDDYKKYKKIVLIGLPEYDNLGDIAIGYAECEFINNNKSKEYTFLPITEKCFEKYFSKIKKIINCDDIILIQGGGNFGNQYYDQERIRKKIISSFKKNKKYLMPSTLFFKDNKRKRFIKRYNKSKMGIFFREKYSYEMGKQFFKNDIYLVPDIVLSLDNQESKNYKREGIAVCIRKDIERKISKDDEKRIKDCIFMNKDILYTFDTCNKSTNKYEDYKTIINNIFKEISSYELVITDKLHCMIFCFLTNTPCIVIENYNHKIKGVYEWIKENPNITLCKNLDDISTMIKQKINNQNCYGLINLNNKFKDLKKIISGE